MLIGLGGRAAASAMFLGFSGASVVLAAAPPDLAKLAGDVEQLRTHLNHVWVMTAAALVLLMQAGFLLLEAGMVRSKNSINVAQKNVVDFLVSAACFAVFGFMLMFGPSIGGLFGSPGTIWGYSDLNEWSYTYFVWHCCINPAGVSGGPQLKRRLADVRVQAPPVSGRNHPAVRALVLQIRHQLPRSGGDDARARR